MHLRPFVLGVALCASGCGSFGGDVLSRGAHGTAVYAAAARASPASLGTVEDSVLVCDITYRPSEPTLVRVGRSCTLKGRVVVGHGSPRGTSALRSDGDCVLPAPGGAEKVRVTSGTLSLDPGVVAVTIGGSTEDGRHVDYRFVGNDANVPASESCEALYARARTGIGSD